MISAVLLAGIAGFVSFSDDSDTAGTSVSDISFIIDENTVTSYRANSGDSIAVTAVFKESANEADVSATYTANLKSSNGTAVNDGVTPGSGFIAIDSEGQGSVDLEVAKQTVPGTYTLVFAVTEDVKSHGDSSPQTLTHTKELKIKFESVKLSMTLKNTGLVGIYGMTVCWWIDGQKIDGSSTAVNMDVGETADIAYDYYGNLSKGAHTYYVVPESQDVPGIGADNFKTFYYGQGSYDYLNYILSMLLFVLIILCVWVFRKPVRNYGKPKARR